MNYTTSMVKNSLSWNFRTPFPEKIICIKMLIETIFISICKIYEASLIKEDSINNVYKKCILNNNESMQIYGF